MHPDRALTAITNDGAFRVMVARTTETVRGAIAAQKVPPATQSNFGDLLTGTTLVRLTMSPAYRVQGIMMGRGGHGNLVADSHPDGGSRGLLQSRDGHVPMGNGAMLQIMRTLYTGAVNQGVVEIANGADMSAALTTYMLESEQITSIIGVGTMIRDGEVLHAGGWVIQLLPECTEPPLAVMYERMRGDFASVPDVLTKFDNDPATILSEILYDMDFTQTQDHELGYRCYCSYERMLAGMSTVGRDDLLDMIDKGEPLFLTCQWCNTDYELPSESLRGLVEQS